MSNRIDLTQFEGIAVWEVEKRPDGGYAIKTGRDNFSLEEAETIAKLPTLIAELKRCYEREDALIEALKIVRDDLDDALETKGYNTLAHEKSERTLQRIRNFANDASQ